MEAQSSLLDLPLDIIANVVFAYLKSRDFLSATRTCKVLYDSPRLARRTLHIVAPDYSNLGLLLRTLPNLESSFVLLPTFVIFTPDFAVRRDLRPCSKLARLSLHQIRLNLSHPGDGSKTFATVLDVRYSSPLLTLADLEFLPKEVKTLALTGSFSVSDNDLIEITKKYPHVEKLKIRGVYRLTQNGFKAIGNLSLLRSIQASGLMRLDADVWKYLAPRLPNLTSLKIRNTYLDDDALNVIAAHCNQLEMVDFAITAITDAAAINFLRSCAKLKHICFQSTAITDRVWEGVADCPSIEIIDFRDCVDVKVAPQYIESAIAKLSNLKEIHLRNLHVNDSTMIAVAEHAPRSLEIINLQGCKSITDAGVWPIIRSNRLPRLHLFNVTGIEFREQTRQEMSKIDHMNIMVFPAIHQVYHLKGN